MNKYHYYRSHGEGPHPWGWAVKGPTLDMYVPDKGLALAITKFLNGEPDAAETLAQLWTPYEEGNR